MKVSNENRRLRFQATNFLYVLIALILAFGYLTQESLITDNYIYIIAAAVLLFLFQRYTGYPFFHYDSEGETLNFYNKKLNVVQSSLVMVRKAEFPKRKLVSYKIQKNLFNKKLELVLQSSKRASNVKIKYDIGYLNKKEIKSLKKSLDKVLEENKNEVQE